MLKNISNNLAFVVIQNIRISVDKNISILFVNNVYFGKILEQLGTWKLDIVQALYKLC